MWGRMWYNQVYREGKEVNCKQISAGERADEMITKEVKPPASLHLAKKIATFMHPWEQVDCLCPDRGTHRHYEDYPNRLGMGCTSRFAPSLGRSNREDKQHLLCKLDYNIQKKAEMIFLTLQEWKSMVYYTMSISLYIY